MSSGPGVRSTSHKLKFASTITSRRTAAIVDTLMILLRASRTTNAQLMARRASISTHYLTIHLLCTGVHPRVDSHKVPM